MSKKRGVILVLCLLLLVGFVVLFMRKRWLASADSLPLTETVAALKTADQGFYYIHGFVLQDSMDCSALVSKSYVSDRNTQLSLVEINLREYNRGPLSDAAIANVRYLFDALRREQRRFIVRFVYDWDGKNMELEPTRRSLVENHMRQLGNVISENKDIIYTLQGLFVGNWGEMNGTRYVGTEHWQALFQTLASVTDADVFLSVRMPMQWRRCTGTDELVPGTDTARLGLFNDGMMGSENDLGTYGNLRRKEATIEDVWCREDELEFQDQLCRYVPNGGEVVFDTEYNDFEAAVANLAKMHVSYLNRDYDRRALDKWASHTVRDGSVWDGMDGLTYIERHLGCRLVADSARIKYAFFPNELSLSVTMRNVGFSPLYREIHAEAVFAGADGEVSMPLDGDLQTICSGETAELTGKLPLTALKRGDQDIYLRVTDGAGKEISVAVREADALGVPIGRIRAK